MYRYCYRGRKPQIDGVFAQHELHAIHGNCKNLKAYLDSILIKTSCEMCEGGHYYYLKTDKPLPERVVKDMQLLEVWETENISDNME
jgi:hypothetical protein